MAHQAHLGCPDRKEQLVEWACQEPLEKRACLASLASRASPAHLERKGRRERRDRQVCLASGFLGDLGTRETKGWQAFLAALERRERRAVPGCRVCRGLQAPRGLRAASAIKEARVCPGRRVTRVFRDWMAFLASKEKQVALGHLASQAPLDRRASPAATASQAQQGRRASQVHLDKASKDSQGPKETKAQRVKWVSPDWPGVPEFLDPKANKDSWVPRGPKDSPAFLVPLAMPWRVPKVTEDRRDSLAFQGFRDPWGLQGSLGWTDGKGKRGIRAGQERLVFQGPRETPDSRACRVLVALRESQAPREIWGCQEFQGSKVRKVFLVSRD